MKQMVASFTGSKVQSRLAAYTHASTMQKPVNVYGTSHPYSFTDMKKKVTWRH